MKDKSKAVSSEDFSRFLAWLDPDPQRAANQYNLFQRRLTIYFAGRGCGMWAAELASQTLDRTAEKFADGGRIEEREPGKYLFQVASFILLEHRRTLESAPLEPDMLRTVPRFDNQIELRCCEQCLAQLGEEERRVLQDYYQGEKQGEAKRIRIEIASDLGVPQGTLRLRVFRLKSKLLQCVTRCLESRSHNAGNSSAAPFIHS